MKEEIIIEEGVIIGEEGEEKGVGGVESMVDEEMDEEMAEEVEEERTTWVVNVGRGTKTILCHPQWTVACSLVEQAMSP